MKKLSYLFIVFGIFCYLVSGYYIWLRNDASRLAFNNYHYTKSAITTTNNPPQRIVIKDLQIDLPLVPSTIHNNKWDTTNDGASYLISSPIPGEDGNSIIYGHNWASLFGNLVSAKPGQEVLIAFADGSKKNFIIEYTSTVSPDQASILASSKDKRITLYTCTGFLDSKRFVVVAKLADNPASFATVTRP